MTWDIERGNSGGKSLEILRWGATALEKIEGDLLGGTAIWDMGEKWCREKLWETFWGDSAMWYVTRGDGKGVNFGRHGRGKWQVATWTALEEIVGDLVLWISNVRCIGGGMEGCFEDLLGGRQHYKMLQGVMTREEIMGTLQRNMATWDVMGGNGMGKNCGRNCREKWQHETLLEAMA